MRQKITRKHTAGVHDVLRDAPIAIENLMTKREERRDGFVHVMEKAITETLGRFTDRDGMWVSEGNRHTP